MAPVTNNRVLFNKLVESTDFIEPGKTFVYDSSQTIDLDTVPINGGILVKLLEISIDYFLPTRTLKEGHGGPFAIGEPITGIGLGVVLRSENTAFKPGDHVNGMLSYENYAVVKEVQGLNVIVNTYNLPWSVFLGSAGLPGLTAYGGWKEYANAKKGETVFVSSGGGPVGSLVIQLAKQEGLKVIASAGSDEKLELMKECGADVVVNYKKGSLKDVLEKEGPVDIYWDNVGGDTLDLALEFANVGAKFLECGMASGYHSGIMKINNAMLIIRKSISMFGIFTMRLGPKYRAQFFSEVPKLIAEGKIKYREQVWNGLEKVGEAMLAVQECSNKAKVIIHVGDM